MLLREGLGLILTLVDIISFFDRESIYDVMQTLHEIGVNRKAAKVWFKLNEGTEVAVKTAAGISESKYVGDCIGQGTAGGALVSQAKGSFPIEKATKLGNSSQVVMTPPLAGLGLF